MISNDLTTRVRELRALRYTPKEIAATLGIGKAEATRLVRAIAAERDSTPEVSCWINPGWSEGLNVDDRRDWPTDRGDEPGRLGSGVAVVLLAVPEAHSRVSGQCLLVDTWCLGVKDAFPVSTSVRGFTAHRAEVFSPWGCEGIRAPIELVRHLVIGAVDFAHRLGFEPHPAFGHAQALLGRLDEPCAIEFGRDGTPFYLNGPRDDAERVLATLDRTVGRGGYHFSVDAGEFADGRYGYSATLTDLEEAA